MKEIYLTDGSSVKVDNCDYKFLKKYIWFPCLDAEGNMHAGRIGSAKDGKEKEGQILLMEYEIISNMTPQEKKKWEEKSKKYQEEQERQELLKQPLKKTITGNA